MGDQRNLIEEIKKLEKQLIVEIQKKEEEFFYKLKGRKVVFEQDTLKLHKTLVTKLRGYLLHARFLNILSAPIIWSCIFPAIFMDLIVSIFHSICFRMYGIPRVARRDYIVIDRHKLGYLNGIEKLNCVYCGYFNGLIAYIQEIAARLEQYWCPIKHANRLHTIHSRYQKFLEYGEYEDYQKKLAALRKDFGDLSGEAAESSKP